MSRSPLDFQDFENRNRKHFSFSSRFTRFLYWNSLSPLDFQDLNKSFSPLDIQDFVPCFSSKLGLRCLPLTFVFHLRRNIWDWKMESSAKSESLSSIKLSNELFMLSSRRSKLFHFSLSTLEIKGQNFNILFLFSKL